MMLPKSLKQLGVIIGLLATYAAPVCAQKNTGIGILGRAQKDRVLLRWAADDAADWKLANQYGYRLERYTVVRDQRLLEKPEKVVLAAVLKPRPLADWQALIAHDSMAAVVAYAIHGQEFTISASSKQVDQIIAGSNELEQRYAFSLFAAERSFPATEYAGWGWADTTARKNEKYLYRVISLVPKEKGKIDSASLFTGLGDYRELPRPVDVTTTFKDRQAVVAWNEYSLREYYTAYHVERSADGGKTFQRLTRHPFFNANEGKGNPASRRTSYPDSLPDNTTAYQYRIIGVTAFNETSPPSAVMTGKGKVQLSFAPDITSFHFNDAGDLELEWKIDNDLSGLVKGFRLNQSANMKGPYKTVVGQIATDQRRLVYKEVGISNYFTITAFTADNQTRTSLPVFVQPPDSVPPSSPVGLTGKVDSNGVVTISWQASQEPDLLGYRVFRKNNPGDEPVPVTNAVFTRHTFKDTISLQVLNRKVYYSIMAIDRRFNESPLSAPLELTKPDKIAPNMPVVTGFTIAGKAITITWAPSSDKDLDAWLLYRKEGANPWKMLKAIRDTTSYTDEGVKTHQVYQYYLVARDEAGLLSPHSKTLELSLLPDVSWEINKLDAYVDRNNHYIQLFWSANPGEVKEYYVYKAEGDKQVSLLKVLSGDKKQFVDEKLTINSSYHYVLRALLKTGDMSKLKEITINY